MDLKARLANKLPALDVGEVPIRVDVAVPQGLFQKPQLQAEITIPESSIGQRIISAEVIDNVREVIAQQTGMDVTVALVEPI